MCVYTYINIYIYTCVCVRMYVCVCVRVCTCVCVREINEELYRGASLETVTSMEIKSFALFHHSHSFNFESLNNIIFIYSLFIFIYFYFVFFSFILCFSRPSAVYLFKKKISVYSNNKFR